MVIHLWHMHKASLITWKCSLLLQLFQGCLKPALPLCWQ